MAPPKSAFTVRLPAAQFEVFRALAAEQGRTVTSQNRVLIAEFLAQRAEKGVAHG